MANVKKNLNARRYGAYSFVLAIVLTLAALAHLKSFFWSCSIVFICVTMSNVNLMLSHGKNNAPSKRPGTHSLPDPRLVTAIRFSIALIISSFVYYIIAVLFGATLIESFSATFYFSCFMTMLTAYPLCLYCWWNDASLVNMLLIFLDFKHETATESYLYSSVTWSIVGAWFGAFPIPLDWDRPWQEWPTTCCVGACLGYAVSHCHAGLINVWSSYRDKRHFSWNIFV